MMVMGFANMSVNLGENKNENEECLMQLQIQYEIICHEMLPNMYVQ